MKAGRNEFELKFTGPPGDVAALIGSDVVLAAAPEGGAWERLSSSYYDAPGRRLAKNGISLRLREEGGALIQAVKIRRVRSRWASTRVRFQFEPRRMTAVRSSSWDCAASGAASAKSRTHGFSRKTRLGCMAKAMCQFIGGTSRSPPPPPPRRRRTPRRSRP